jgi:hypothetical protein
MAGGRGTNRKGASVKKRAYLAKLDAFLVNLAGDSQMGLILGLDERHGEHLNYLLLHRSDLDYDAPRKVPVGVVDALESIERSVREVRASLKNGLQAS